MLGLTILHSTEPVVLANGVTNLGRFVEEQASDVTVSISGLVVRRDK